MAGDTIRERAVPDSAAFYRVWVEWMDLAWSMALPHPSDPPDVAQAKLAAFGRGLVLENESRDEALRRMLTDPPEEKVKR
ncbi:MAG: hypothetical protein HYZ53_03600 [Planctomycetes bacterium]|nr:hypothetical protein [Planctomycetota bacterium]